jgi:hypothetical protein
MHFGPKGFRYGRDRRKGRGVFANSANALVRQHPPTEGELSNNCWYQKCQAGQGYASLGRGHVTLVSSTPQLTCPLCGQ